MSRILKASYVKIDTQNILIDNKIENIDIYTQNTNEDTQMEENLNEQNSEEYIKSMQEEVLEMARTQADTIIANAKKEAEEIKANAWEEMNTQAEEIYKKSYDEANEKVMLEIQEEKQQLEKTIEESMKDIEEQREQVLNKIEPDILNLVINTVKNVLSSEYAPNIDIINILIQKGLQNVKEIKDIKIYVSENNYEYVSENKDNITNTNAEVKNIQVIKDTSLNDTDCIIETSMGSINCGIDEQLKGIKEAMHHILN